MTNHPMFSEFPPSQESIRDSREEGVYSDSSVPPMYDSEDSSSYVPEDLSAHGQGELQVKEEPQEEAVSAKDGMSTASVGSEEPGVGLVRSVGSFSVPTKTWNVIRNCFATSNPSSATYVTKHSGPTSASGATTSPTCPHLKSQG